MFIAIEISLLLGPFRDHSWQAHAFMLIFPGPKPFIGFFPSCIQYLYLFSLTLKTLVLKKKKNQYTYSFTLVSLKNSFRIKTPWPTH